MTTYRLTEHHTAGGDEPQPRVPRRAPARDVLRGEPAARGERDLEPGGCATIVTVRTAIEARVKVTDRVAPLVVQGRTLHQVGLPYHWGRRGLSTGDSANDLFALALDPNVHIQEVKAATCDIVPGRRPRGPALLAFVDRYRRRARESPSEHRSQRSPQAGEARPARASASSPTRRCASAARRARSRARSGTTCPTTGSSSSTAPTTTRARSARAPGATSRSSSRRSRRAPTTSRSRALPNRATASGGS